MAEQAALNFASLLRQLRDDAGLTQEELARAAALSPRTVSDLERGVHQSAQKDTAGLLADALRLTGPVHRLFVAAARGRATAAAVLAARADASLTLLATPPAGGGNPIAGGPVPRELPADVNAFTGRGLELAELDLLLPSETAGMPGPVVISAVSGTAGVGKTALAVRWAHRAAVAFPDGQLYVNLRGYDPGQPLLPAEALAGFLRALGVPGQDIPPGEEERAARYRSMVAQKRLLVVLDNASTVEQVRPLLPGSQSVMVLVTSRDALAGLVARDGARRLDLDLLPSPDAVTLLRALIGNRAGTEPAATQALAQLCARLPLALRVAAERAAARPDRPLAELVTELAEETERLALLSAEGDPRAAVTSVFSWSYRHLPDGAARMFRLLGLHPGADWDRSSAAALAGTSVAGAGQLLDVLARAHLIEPAGSGRYTAHDLLRAYAAGLVAAQDSDQARRAALTRLFDFYLASCSAAMDLLDPAERQHRPEPPPADVPAPGLTNAAAARTWLDTTLPTLTAVAAHTAEHGWPGHATRLASTLHRYLDSGHDIDGLLIWGHALTAARDRGDHAAEASALARLGVFHGRQGRYEQAAACHHESLTLARDAGDQLAQARALGNLALVHDEQGRYLESARCQGQALELYTELGDLTGQAISRSNLGLVCLRQGRYQQAVGQLEEALLQYRGIGHRFGEAVALTNLGAVRHRQGNWQQAAELQDEALRLARELGNRRVAAWALTRRGEARSRQARHAEAVADHQQALEGFREIGDREGEADALNGVGETLLAAGEPGQARACHTGALTLTRRTGNQRAQARALCLLGAVCEQEGQQAEAAGHYQQALACYRAIGDEGGEAEALNGAAENQAASGQHEQARNGFTAARHVAQRTGDRYQLARAHLGLAAAYAAAGDETQARRWRRRAQDGYDSLGIPEALQRAAGRE